MSFNTCSTFTAACYDFASFLFCMSRRLFPPFEPSALLNGHGVIEIFRDTLVPASLVGLFTKLVGLIFSGSVGGLVDSLPRLPLIRWSICAEKVFKLANYAVFLGMLQLNSHLLGRALTLQFSSVRCSRSHSLRFMAKLPCPLCWRHGDVSS